MVQIISFFINYLIIAILFMFLTFLVFLIRPNNIYMYGELKKIEGISECQANAVKLSKIYNARIKSQNTINIILDEGTINDLECEIDDYLEITPIYDKSLICLNGKMIEVEFSGKEKEIISVKSNSIYSKSSSYTLQGKQTLQVFDATLRFVHDGKSTLMNNTELFIKPKDNTKISTLIFEGGSKSKELIETQFDSFGELSLHNVKMCRMISSGEIYVSYIPKTDKYKIYNQEINLVSKNSELAVEYDMTSKTGELSGYLKKITLSRISLIPNWRNWYFSNLYIAPVTFIGAIFTAMEFMKQRK